ncbi:MAG: metalloregulator ArsR/SmtB family transcription factor [Paracoccaceae bacterium]|nr:metalloregulator ArsR/SmtB family transcription factor [Paracoccaceae bacterium]
MDERDSETRLTDILKAASDPTRRRILTLLVQEGPMRVTDLAGHFEMSLNAVSKHIKVLERSRLVARARAWRDHVISAELDELKEIDRWFGALRSVWDTRLEALDKIINEETADDDAH